MRAGTRVWHTIPTRIGIYTNVFTYVFTAIFTTANARVDICFGESIHWNRVSHYRI